MLRNNDLQTLEKGDQMELRSQEWYINGLGEGFQQHSLLLPID